MTTPRWGRRDTTVPATRVTASMNLLRYLNVVENSISYKVGMNMQFEFEEVVAAHNYARKLKRNWWSRK